jgi:Predicted metal-dependent hydrolase
MSEARLHHEGHPKYRRMVRFDWSQTPIHWMPDDPFSTHMINVLHLLLPEGERHFIKAVLEASSLVDDPELEAAIKPFIQQGVPACLGAPGGAGPLGRAGHRHRALHRSAREIAVADVG